MFPLKEKLEPFIDATPDDLQNLIDEMDIETEELDQLSEYQPLKYSILVKSIKALSPEDYDRCLEQLADAGEQRGWVERARNGEHNDVDRSLDSADLDAINETLRSE